MQGTVKEGKHHLDMHGVKSTTQERLLDFGLTSSIELTGRIEVPEHKANAR